MGLQGVGQREEIGTLIRRLPAGCAGAPDPECSETRPDRRGWRLAAGGWRGRGERPVAEMNGFATRTHLTGPTKRIVLRNEAIWPGRPKASFCETKPFGPSRQKGHFAKQSQFPGRA